MKAIIVVMLCVQLALVLATAWTVVFAKSRAGRPRPVWSSLAIGLIIGAGASAQIADLHDLSAGARLLQFGSGILLGMGLLCLLLLLRQARGTDRVLRSVE